MINDNNKHKHEIKGDIISLINSYIINGSNAITKMFVFCLTRWP